MSIQSVSNLSLATNQTTSRAAAVDRSSNVSETEARTTVSTNLQTQSSTGEKSDRGTLEEVVKAVNDFVKPFNDTLSFSIDEDTGTTVVKVIDTETDTVIKQMPSEEMLALAKALDQLQGLLVKQKA